MLNHVERRRILEQPAGKDLAPGQRAVGIGPFLDKDLHEGPGLGRALPRQGPLAGGEPDDDIADPPRLAGLQHDVLGDIVALVEQAERGDAVLDRGAVFAFDRRHAGLGRDVFGNFGSRGIGLIAAAARGQQKQHKARREQAPHDQASGLQAS
jgi:hypothetical protein